MTQDGFWMTLSRSEKSMKDVSYLKRTIQEWTEVFRLYEDTNAIL